MMHVAAARRGELPGLRRRPDRSRAPAACSTRCCAGHEDGRAAFELWEAAVEAGGPDDITMALVRLRTWNRGRPRRGVPWVQTLVPRGEVTTMAQEDTSAAVTGQRHAAEHADVERRHVGDHAQVSQRHLAAHEELYGRH